MISLKDYQDRYKFIKLSRDAEGVLTMRLHYEGGKFLWGLKQHDEVADCLLHISRDRGNKVVILTGTGDSFLEGPAPTDETSEASMFSPTFKDSWSQIISVGHRLIENHLDVEVPMIGVVNGPATWHAELAVLCDIVICADDAYFQDFPHVPGGLVPGDGVHVIWPELLGVNRGRYFLLTGQKIGADEARQLGIVSEVMPRGQLMDRAQSIAAGLAARDHIFLRHTRSVIVQKLRKQVSDLLPLGLHAEYAAALTDHALPRPDGVAWTD